MRVAPACFLVLLLLAACSTRRGSPGDDGGTLADAGQDAGRDGGPARDAPPFDAGPDLSDVLVYAHSRDALYSFSPTDLAVMRIGAFTLSDGTPAPFMLDLAVDGEGRMFTSSDEDLWSVDVETAVATRVGAFELGGERLFALSFLAPGEHGPDETLVGATNEGAYYQIDEATARGTLLGRYPDGWLSSGDIVSVAGLGTFATARRSDFASDVLIRIAFAADGSSTATMVGPTRNSSRNFVQLFGLGYWGRVLYGFSNAGELVEIDRESGDTRVVSSDTGASSFWGAGVTTRAPVLF